MTSGGSGIAADAFSALGLGLLLGIVVGLSISPVVSIVVGALTSLLAVFLGLESSKESKIRILGGVGLNAVRIGTFGLCTVLGLLLALYIRINNPFTEPLEEYLKRWKEVNLPETVIHQMVLHDRTGVLPRSMSIAGKAGGSDPGTGPDTVFAKNPLLKSAFSGEVCSELAPGSHDHNAEKIVERYEIEGGIFEELASAWTTETKSGPRSPAEVKLNCFKKEEEPGVCDPDWPQGWSDDALLTGVSSEDGRPFKMVLSMEISETDFLGMAFYSTGDWNDDLSRQDKITYLIARSGVDLLTGFAKH